MKRTNQSRKRSVALAATFLVTAVVAFFAYGAGAQDDSALEPYCLTVSSDPSGGMSGAAYKGETIYIDSQNTQRTISFGVDLTIERVTVERENSSGELEQVEEDCITSLVLRSVKVEGELSSVYLPDEIAIDYNGTTLKRKLTNVEFYYYTPEQGNTERNSFIDSPNLRNVYVGPSATNVSWYGEDFLKLRNFHFRSQEVANFSFNEGADGTINIYVPEALFAHYTEVIQGASYTTTVWSEDPLSPTYVNVDIPGTLADAISANIENLDQVRWLVVTGTPNEQDLRIMRRLPRLEILDLSGTKGLNTMVGCNGLKYLREVTLPDGITEIGKDAFMDCISLAKVRLPNGLTMIGAYAFWNCKSLEEMELPSSVKIIKDNSFAGSYLRSINLEDVESIGYFSFGSTKLESINLSHAKSIDGYAFGNCGALTTVNFDSIQSIQYNAFSGCDIRELKLPNSLKRLEYSVFDGNYNLKEVEFGSGLKYVGGGDFWGCPIEKVTIRTLFPTETSGFGEVDNATLYVPALTLNEYLLADGWTMFKDVKPLDEELTDVNIDRTFMLTSDRGIAKGANLSLRDEYMMTDGGHLSVRRNINAPLNLGKYYQGGRNYRYDNWVQNGYIREYRYEGSTLIPYSEMTAEDIELKITLHTGMWHFISLPFDVNVKDIKVTDEALWVVRKYSGADRAALNENTWQNMTEETKLEAGEGYIFHCAHDNTSDVDFIFRPASEESGNQLFAKESINKELKEYVSEFAHNASWNLVGNTYPAYLNIHTIGFDGPVTIYNGETYVAYSPVDDEIVLNPFQAFFVQRLDGDGGDVLTLNPGGRAHTAEEAAALKLETRAGSDNSNDGSRSLFNIRISGENGSDRTRLVVNENASMAYEKNRDASKFMSGEKDAVQIFVLNNNSRMAIDERPLGSGEISLGAVFGKKGEYTISLDSRNAEGYTPILVDNKTGTSTDLSVGDYTFESDATTDNSRFTLELKETSSSSVETVDAASISVKIDGQLLSVTAPEAINIMVVTADGKPVTSVRSADFSTILEKGIYVVKAGATTTKVMIGR